jgi:hypothetical protein
VVSGTNLFVTSFNPNDGLNGTIGEYTTSGATVSASLVTGLNHPEGIALSGTNLFVVNGGGYTIGEYTTSGSTVNPALFTGVNQTYGIAASGGKLFITNYAGAASGEGTIGEYTTSGETVNDDLISGLSGPTYIAVEAAPVPLPKSAWGGLALMFGMAILRFRRNAQRAIVT